MNNNTRLLLNRLSELPFKDDIELTLFQQKTKNPFTLDWINDKNSKYNIEQIKEELKRNPNQNIGLMHNNFFIIIDIDSELTDENILYMAVKDLFKPTFMTKTAKGCHAIYIADEDIPNTHIELKLNNIIYGEYRHNNHHVVEAGSIHKTGVEYEVMQDLPINNFDIKDFDNLMNLFGIKPSNKKKQSTKSNQKTLLNTPQNKLLLDDVANLINTNKTNFSKRKDEQNNEYFFWKGVLPNHESEGGKHATIKYFPDSGHVAWNCFQHEGDNSTRNFKTLKAMVEGVCSCESTAMEGPSVIEDINTAETNSFYDEQLNINFDDKLLVDKIIKDPIHDLLLKFNTYNYIENNKSQGKKIIYTEDQVYAYNIIKHLIDNDSTEIGLEIIKYANKSEFEDFYINHKTGFKQSYYSVINDFIFTTNQEIYNHFITAFNSSQTLETIDFDVIKQFFSKSKFTAYNYNLNKWTNTSQTDFKLYNIDDLLNGDFKQNFIVQNFIVDDGISLISAEKGAGKTMMTMSLLFSIATGRDFMGLKTIQSPVLFLDLENGENVYAPRIKGMIKGMDFNQEEFKFLKQNMNTIIKQKGWGFVFRENNELILNHGNLNEILSVCKEKNIKLIAIDPMVNLGQFQETNEDFIFLKNMVFDKFLEQGISVVILHHLTKGSDKNGNKSARGGGALEGFVVTSYNMIVEKLDHNGNAKRVSLYRIKGRNGEINNITYDVDVMEKVKDNTKEYEHIKLTKVERLGGLLPEQQSVLEAMTNQEYYTTDEFKTLLLENNLIKENTIHWKKSKEVQTILSYVDKLLWKNHSIRDGSVPTNGAIYVLKQPKVIEDEDE